MYSKFLNEGKEASEWGAWESMYYIVVAVAGVSGGWVAETYGFVALFAVMLVLAVIGLIVSTTLVTMRRRSE